MIRFTVRALTATALLASSLTTAVFAGPTGSVPNDLTISSLEGAIRTKPAAAGFFVMMRRNPGRTSAMVIGTAVAAYAAGWYCYNHPEFATQLLASAQTRIQPLAQPAIDTVMPYIPVIKAYATQGWNMLPTQATNYVGQAASFFQSTVNQGYGWVIQSYDTLNLKYNNVNAVLSLVKDRNLPELLNWTQSTVAQIASAKDFLTAQKTSIFSNASSFYTQASTYYEQLPSTNLLMGQAGEFLAEKIRQATVTVPTAESSAMVPYGTTIAKETTIVDSILSIAGNIKETAGNLPSWNEATAFVSSFFIGTK